MLRNHVIHVPEPEFLRCKFINIAAHFTAGGRTLLKQNAWNCTLVMLAEMERQVARAGDRFEVFSAGTRPGTVRPEAIAVMRELGIDLSTHRSKHVDEFSGQTFDLVLTVCDNAKENCPVFPGSYTIHQSFDDPATVQDFRRVRDEIRAYLRTLPIR